MARVHILQHVSFEGPGMIDPWLRRRQHEATLTRLHAGDRLPDVADFDWLIVMGGPMGVYDYCEHPWLRAEKELIAEAIGRGRVVLGICLGAQLIADALHAPVVPGVTEIGWFPLAATEDALDNPFGRLLAGAGEVFHWHGDHCGVPEGAVHLMRSAACDVQAFSIADRVLALQCHLEMTPPVAAALCRESGRDLMRESPWIQRPDEILRSEERFAAANRVMEKLLLRLEAALTRADQTALETLAPSA